LQQVADFRIDLPGPNVVELPNGAKEYHPTPTVDLACVVVGGLRAKILEQAGTIRALKRQLSRLGPVSDTIEP